MGPGEFSLPTKLWWSDGGLSVLDGNLLRVTDIDQNGLLRSTRPLSAVGVSLERRGRDRILDRAPRVLRLHLDEPLEISSYFSQHCGFFL